MCTQHIESTESAPGYQIACQNYKRELGGCCWPDLNAGSWKEENGFTINRKQLKTKTDVEYWRSYISSTLATNAVVNLLGYPSPILFSITCSDHHS